MRDKRRNNSNRDLTKTNEQIRFPTIRVIDSDGGQVGIISPREALVLAQEKNLDLVLISETADPPVCKIMDYGKYKYEQDKKLKEAKKKQHNADVKEVKMRYKIEEHDYNVRVKNAQRFLKSGDKVKATVSFRGREIQHANLAEDLLRRMASDLEDFAEVQQYPKREGRNMMMLLSPKKST
ncbi:MAG: translation initiation factor IF-3 [Xenococcaceae cyanobacterium MO_167.B27]|nr:translation initiation factor IF-3 [Xenococcaceae cyanobacterium MO_167.B27]